MPEEITTGPINTAESETATAAKASIQEAASTAENEVAKDAQPASQTPEEIQAAADRAAVIASGIHHLDNIFNQEIQTISRIIAVKVHAAIHAAERAENWTFAAVKEFWNKERSAIETAD